MNDQKTTEQTEFELGGGYTATKSGDRWFLVDDKGKVVGDDKGFEHLEQATDAFIAAKSVPADDPDVQEYIRLDRYYSDVVKPFYEQMDAAKAALERKFGLGAHWQDGSDGVVYLTHEPQYKSVRMEHFGVMRTRRPDEKKGDLSLDKARALGYEVEGK